MNPRTINALSPLPNASVAAEVPISPIGLHDIDASKNPIEQEAKAEAEKSEEGVRAVAAALGVSRLLIRVDMPHDVVGQAVDAVPGPLGHLGKAFGLGLVFERITGEIDAYGTSERHVQRRGGWRMPGARGASYQIGAHPPSRGC